MIHEPTHNHTPTLTFFLNYFSEEGADSGTLEIEDSSSRPKAQ